MNQNNLSHKDTLDLILFVKEHFIDVDKRNEIELAKIKTSNDLKYQELNLQLLEMKMKRENNRAIMDLILTLLSSALQILSPFLEKIQSAYPMQSQTTENETIKIAMKSPSPVEGEQISPIPTPIIHGSRT